MTEPLSWFSIPKIISAIWANGSRFLFSVAVAGIAAAAVLWLGARYGAPKAQAWWYEYGLMLVLVSAVAGVFAIFKFLAERQITKLFLIADEAQSHWSHAKQPDGSIVTQFSFQFHATNRGRHGLYLSRVRVLRPSFGRRRIQSAMMATEDPMNDVYATNQVIPAGARRGCHAHIMATGAVGGEGRTKPMRVKIAVQDNIGRWYKLVFVDVRNPAVPRW
jgi:hypothetical protein